MAIRSSLQRLRYAEHARQPRTFKAPPPERPTPVQRRGPHGETTSTRQEQEQNRRAAGVSAHQGVAAAGEPAAAARKRPRRTHAPTSPRIGGWQETLIGLKERAWQRHEGKQHAPPNRVARQQ
jgi:hypothetical protein